ncbi:MAG: VWA domain-containing protein [Cyanobacteria bacterium J06621_11]
MKKLKFTVCLCIGLCFSLLWACSIASPEFDSFDAADAYLRDRILPNIQVSSQLVSDTDAYNAVIPPLEDAIPDPETYPLYGAQPTNDPNIVYVEVYSSAEKANAARDDERWLVDVAEQFNQQQQRLSSGEIIQVGVRNIPSGLGAQIIGAGKGKPAGYTPAHALWPELLKADGIQLETLSPALVSSHAMFALRPDIYQKLEQNGEVTFDRLMEAILAGEIRVGYSNPYIASSALNFLYTTLWRSAGHHQDGKPLTLAEIASPEVSSVFDTFQQQVALTTPTYLDLKQIWLRDKTAFDAIVMAHQSYAGLIQERGFDDFAYVPFGVAETSPLVSFDWTSDREKSALERFAAFATSEPMQQLALKQGYEQTPYLNAGEFPPIPDGDVLKTAQSFWKQRKDGGRTVYMELVVDTSGSMASKERLSAVQSALQFASSQINPGNQVGLVTFSGKPTHRMHLAPFSELEKKRLFTAIEQMRADGGTALYDGLAVGLSELMTAKKNDPEGEFYLLLLTDGEQTRGIGFERIEKVLEASGVKVYPISYGEVNQKELEAIAAIRETPVFKGTPKQVQGLLKDLFQTSL